MPSFQAPPAVSGRSVGIVGVGNMGGGIATNLLARNYQVHVHDIDLPKVDFYQKKGALSQASAGQLASNTTVTIVCVVNAEQTEQVLFGSLGLAAAAATGHVVLLCPTIAPQDVELFATRLSQHGIQTIDAPMSGGPARAANGSMSLMVACSDPLYAQHAPLLKDLSSQVSHISQRIGDGARTKLVNNLLAGINLVAAAEAMVLAQRMGLDLHKTLGVIQQSSGQSWIGTDRMSRALQGDHVPRAHMGLLAKDTALAIQAAELLTATGYPGPLGKHAMQTFAYAVDQGSELEDDSTMFRLLKMKLVGK
jgi:L-threonate 2-dehydrogenase